MVVRLVKREDKEMKDGKRVPKAVVKAIRAHVSIVVRWGISNGNVARARVSTRSACRRRQRWIAFKWGDAGWSLM
jgi:hypothetical protein